jgi:hypothetical protein
MKKSLRILTVLSIAASSILFAAPSFAVSVGGVDVTVSGKVTIASSSANKVNLGGSSSGGSDSVNFDFGGSAFSVANMYEWMYSVTTVGIPSTPELGYNKTINMNIGYGYMAKADIYNNGSISYQALCPSGNFTAPATCSGQKTNRAFTPFIQLNYTASSGVLSVRVPVTSGTGAYISINSDGSYSLSSGTVTSWVELTNFVVGAGANTAPGAPTSVTATSTGATTANVSFTAPASNGGATITSYTATSSPGGITGTISQAGSGTIAMTGLTAGTAYTFTVTATNSAGTSVASSASNSATTVGAPTVPTSVVATATGKRSATVSFAAPASNGGSVVTSYTATSTPGGITQTLTQAAGGTFNFDGLQPGTAYTFAVTATNAIGTSAAATSNSITTTPLVVASLSSLSFADDGTGTGGKIVWSGTSIDAVLYTGSSAYYPGPYNYGAFSSGWNGRIRNLTPGTEYTVSLFVVSADGVGESKSLTFKTSATLPALAGAKSATISQADQMAAQLPKLFAWINENVFVDGEGDRMKTLLNKFDATVVPAHSAYLKLPNSSVVKVSASTSTPAVCKVEGQVTVHSVAAGTCTISYTVVGKSKAPATLVKSFTFKKFAK